MDCLGILREVRYTGKIKLGNQNVLKTPRFGVLNSMDHIIGQKSKRLHSAFTCKKKDKERLKYCRKRKLLFPF